MGSLLMQWLHLLKPSLGRTLSFSVFNSINRRKLQEMAKAWNSDEPLTSPREILPPPLKRLEKEPPGQAGGLECRETKCGEELGRFA